MEKDKYRFGLLLLSFILFPFLVALPLVESVCIFHVAPKPMLSIIGSVVELIGAILLVSSRIILGRYGSISLAIEKGHKLVQTGPYKYVRNPIYSGFLLLMAGYCVALYSYVTPVLAVIFLMLFLAKRIKIEEDILEKEFKEEYVLYRKKTKKLIPFIY